jgi:hypothetical protein
LNLNLLPTVSLARASPAVAVAVALCDARFDERQRRALRTGGAEGKILGRHVFDHAPA